MKTEDLNYDLPQELIAQNPCQNRSESRLLVLDKQTGKLIDSKFADIGTFLRAGDCLVLNDTRVLTARFYARRNTGGKLEGLFLQETNDGLWEVMLKGAGKVKLEEKILLNNIQGGDYCGAEIVEKKEEGKCLLKVEINKPAEEILEEIGFAPVPPYIRRNTDLGQAVKDKQRYQTIYAKQTGAIAAPTAGLHWTKELLKELETKGIRTAYITLHVGEGTFKPVKTDTMEEHKIHREWFGIDEKNVEIINETKKAGGRIIAVGTTSVRTLESAAKEPKKISAMSGHTELFILPGYEFKIVDAIVTNFHLPKSTLLALIAAFAGLDKIMAAYKYAIEKKYRFYSYGDAMLII